MTPDQQALVDLAAEILRGRTSNEQLAKVEASTARMDETLWGELVAAGLVGIAVPEEYGGAGLGLTEVCLLLEQHGRRIPLVPLWESLVAALSLARYGSTEQKGRWLPGVADGTHRLTVVIDLSHTVGAAALVPSAAGADAALSVCEDGVFLVGTDGLERVDVETLTHGTASQQPLPRRAEDRLDADAAWVRDAARVALAAGQLGNTDEGVHEAAAYLSQREQFGRPLATFQAVSQQLGDAYCDVQAMRATLWQAVWALEQGSPQEEAAARRAVDVATWWACDAGLRVQAAVQHLHGGLGADTTYPVHRRLLWALQTDALLGGASSQLARLGAALV